MDKADRASGLFWLVFSLFVSYQSYKLGLGILHQPGPGFLFFWTGVVTAILSLIIIVMSLRNRPAEENSGTRSRRLESCQDRACGDLSLRLRLVHGMAGLSYRNPAPFHFPLGGDREKKVVVCGPGEPSYHNTNVYGF